MRCHKRAYQNPRCIHRWAPAPLPGQAVLLPPTRRAVLTWRSAFCHLQGISGAVRAYLQLHDRPSGGQEKDEAALLASMTAEEQKK